MRASGKSTKSKKLRGRGIEEEGTYPDLGRKNRRLPRGQIYHDLREGNQRRKKKDTWGSKREGNTTTGNVRKRTESKMKLNRLQCYAGSNRRELRRKALLYDQKAV